MPGHVRLVQGYDPGHWSHWLYLRHSSSLASAMACSAIHWHPVMPGLTAALPASRFRIIGHIGYPLGNSLLASAMACWLIHWHPVCLVMCCLGYQEYDSGSLVTLVIPSATPSSWRRQWLARLIRWHPVMPAHVLPGYQRVRSRITGHIGYPLGLLLLWRRQWLARRLICIL